MEHEHIQMMYNVIAILTKKLGGEVELTRQEIQDPPVATFTRVDDLSTNVALRLKVEE